jgi:hypothetical protein
VARAPSAAGTLRFDRHSRRSGGHRADHRSSFKPITLEGRYNLSRSFLRTRNQQPTRSLRIAQQRLLRTGDPGRELDGIAIGRPIPPRRPCHEAPLRQGDHIIQQRNGGALPFSAPPTGYRPPEASRVPTHRPHEPWNSASPGLGEMNWIVYNSMPLAPCS